MAPGSRGPQGTPPSIFNDVIGPVMRGPSSSHCAAALRIGRLARDLMGGRVTDVLVEFHPGGSLATTHESQGSDMGLFGGLLGWDAQDPRLVASARALAEAGIRTQIRITDFPATHPNTYRLTLAGPGGTHRMTALSTGGGMIEVAEVDGITLSMAGDCHETLLFLGDAPEKDVTALERFLKQDEGVGEILLHEGPEAAHGHAEGGRTRIVEIRGQSPPRPEVVEEVMGRFASREIRTLAPVFPVQSPRIMDVPFLSARELLAYKEGRAAAGKEGLDLWELAVRYESARGGISEDEVLGRMRGIVGIMEEAIREGLRGTEYADRILGPQSGSFGRHMGSGRLLDAGILNRMILYVTAVMEVKSSMGVIVAAPTAGACGALPGACIGAAHALGRSTEDVARAVLAAGMVGVFIAARSTFAAEVCGCQAECGAASGMAAAALVTLAGGTAEEALAASSMALQNTLG
jgi:L-serine dehydratase